MIGGMVTVLLSPFIRKMYYLGEFESDWTTENGEYHVHITRMGKRRPYMQVKINDKTRNRRYYKTFRNKDLIQTYDAEKMDEVLRELVLWYESNILKKLTRK